MQSCPELPKSQHAVTRQDTWGLSCWPRPHSVCRKGQRFKVREGSGLRSADVGFDRGKGWSDLCWFQSVSGSLLPALALHTHHFLVCKVPWHWHGS